MTTTTTTSTTETTTKTQTKTPGIFANRTFVLASMSSFVSMLGDQLTLIGLPWLMLSLTNSPAAVGIMFALIGLPRALFMLVGGALSDKFNPRVLLSVTRFCSVVVLSVLTFMAWTDTLQATQLYVFAAVLGLTSALGMPAGSSILPRILPKEQLGAGNSIVMAGGQLSALLGPVMAGALLYLFSTMNNTNVGYALVFGLDALTFLFALIALQFLHLGTRSDEPPAAGTSVIDYLREGWQVLRADRSLLIFIVYIGLINLFTTGPVMVGVPILVRDTLHGSALAYGSFLATMNIGVLVAMIGSRMVPALSVRNFLPVILSLDFSIGLLMILFVNVQSQYALQAILLVVGMLAGYIQVTLVTRIQKRVEQRYMGRVMSYLMFAYLGLVPLSASFAGWLIGKASVVFMFELMGVAICAMAVLFLANKDMRQLAAAPTAAAA